MSESLPSRPWRDRLRPRLRTVLVAVNLLVLALPLAGIGVLRLYESELVRRTEAELIGQGALIAEAYAQQVRLAQARGIDGGKIFGTPADSAFWSAKIDKAPIAPRPPRLHRSTSIILPDTPVAQLRDGHDDPVAIAAGKAMGDLLRRATRTTLSGMRVAGPKGYVVATSRGGQDRYIGHWSEVKEGLRGKQTSYLRQRRAASHAPSLRSVSRGTPVRVFVGHPIVVDGRVWGVVVLSRTPLDVAKALFINRRDLSGGALVLLLVVGLVAFLTSRLLARPLRDLRDQAARVATGERGPVDRIPHAGTQEVADLSNAISKMAEALQGRAAYLEAFSRNVSHAFKTPLTTIRGTVELLQDHLDDMEPAQRAKFLGNLEAEAARLDRLVRRLMVLARADVLDPGVEQVEVQQVFDEVQRRHGRVCKVTTQVSNVSVAMSAETLDAIVDNLVENAVKHGANHVAVTLPSTSEDTLKLVVTDDGPGVDEDIASRLFEPFATTAGARGGTGLGLAIVRALARAHGGDVHLVTPNTESEGAQFCVTLPSRSAPQTTV